MADIPITCEKCGAVTMLSEYAKPDGLTCPGCGAPLALPKTDRSGLSDSLLPEAVRRERAAKAAAQAAAEQDPNRKPAPTLQDALAKVHRVRRKRSRAQLLGDTLRSLLLFVFMAGGLAYLRYLGGFERWLPSLDFDVFKTVGMGAILFFHIVIVIDAMTQDFLTGLFCLIIPGFSIFYLFTESDAFWLRAIVGSLVLAFGLDFALAARQMGLDFFAAVNEWLARGGEWK